MGFPLHPGTRASGLQGGESDSKPAGGVRTEINPRSSAADFSIPSLGRRALHERRIELDINSGQRLRHGTVFLR